VTFLENKKQEDSLMQPRTILALPHHHFEKDSPTTPICIVFDCSCRQGSNHPCLNDCLMIGFPCSNNLCAILLHFRLHRCGISTNIEKAFLHIHLHPEVREFTRFFWLTDPADPSSKFCVYSTLWRNQFAIYTECHFTIPP